MTFAPESGKHRRPQRTPFCTVPGGRWVWVLVACLVGAGTIASLTGLGKSAFGQAPQGGPPSPQGVPVVVTAARQGDIGIYVSGLGTVTPLNTVTVKTRVDGQLMKVLYREGEIVKNGAVLAEIDSRPFEAQLTQAEGQMVRDQALLENARLDLKRYETLSRQDSIAQQLYDTQKSLVKQLEGTVKFDQGQIDSAKVQLVYCRITAPVAGRVGLRLVDPGNIVHASDTGGLVVITQLQPITVIFPIPEDSLPPVLKKLKTGERLPVEAFDREQKTRLGTGHLLTADNQIDPTTGTVRLRAEFPNQDNELFPNQFVNARLLLETRRGATVVPTAAIQRSPAGPFVYVVGSEQKVAVRQVKVGPLEKDTAAIDEGLSPGEVVVLEGAEKLREGSKVDAKMLGAEDSQKGN